MNRTATTTAPKQDQFLWNDFQQGSKVAFGRLYQQYYRELLDYGVRHTGERELTADCIQDFFLYVWSHWENLSKAQSIRIYLLTSYRRRLFRYLEKKRKGDYRRDEFGLQSYNESPSTEQNIISGEEEAYRVVLVKKLLTKLSPRQREVVYLRYFQGLSPNEISQVMGISYQTVVNHLCEAIKSLRTKVQKIA